jgi:MoxR-like ATPases
MTFDQIRELGERLNGNISRVIVGKKEIIKLVCVSLFCSGHVLMEDIPGVGKTMLAKCLAKSIACDFKRIQFTPDLLPSDLTGINYFNQKNCEFTFNPGPIFTNIVLADEINRATPRTQASLLECMEEGQVTIDGVTKALDAPFFVMATQNPIETQGTYPLPEAQMDRFFMRLRIGYPTPLEGRQILDRFIEDSPIASISSVLCSKDIVDIQKSCQSVKVGEAVRDYIIDIVEATRRHERIGLGVSPRGSLALMKASQAYAIFEGRSYVTPDDIKTLAVPVLAHRLLLKGHTISNSASSAESVISDILLKVNVPVEEVLDGS